MHHQERNLSNKYLSDNGKSFPEIHLIIMNSSPGYAEFITNVNIDTSNNHTVLIFNRRNSEKGIFNTLVNRFMKESPWPLKRIYELNG